MENEGFEISLNTVNISRPRFRWSTDFNFATLHNEITALLPGMTFMDIRTAVGRSLNDWYIHEFAGVNPADGRPMYYDSYGNITYLPTFDDRRWFGPQNPTRYGGITNTFQFGNLTFSFFLQYSGGNVRRNAEIGFGARSGNMGDFIQFRSGVPRQYVNAPGFTLRGLEYQLIWRPSERTELRLNQSFNQMRWHQAGPIGREPPARLSTVAWFQRLDDGWDVALMLHEHNGMSWRPPASAVGSVTRVDARLARAFDWGGARAEAALVVQSLGGDIDEFVPNRLSNRRVYASLRLEF